MQNDDSATLARMLDESGWRFYAITTSDRPERQRRLREEFARLSVDVTIHVGDRPADANGFAGIGYWGCFASHLACLEQARADGATVAVIAEDDVVVATAFARHMPQVVLQLERRLWSMAYLGYLRASSPARHTGLELVTRNLGRLEGWEIAGSHLYAVHARAFDSLIDDFQARLEPGGHRIAADGVLNEYRRDGGLETLVCLPNLGYQAPSPSGITSASGVAHRIRTSILRQQMAQRWVESAKRLGWDLWSSLPVQMHARAWNARVPRQSRG